MILWRLACLLAAFALAFPAAARAQVTPTGASPEVWSLVLDALERGVVRTGVAEPWRGEGLSGMVRVLAVEGDGCRPFTVEFYPPARPVTGRICLVLDGEERRWVVTQASEWPAPQATQAAAVPAKERRTAPSSPPPAPPEPPRIAAPFATPQPAPMGPGSAPMFSSSGSGGFVRMLTPVVAELPSDLPRLARNGGSAVALLSSGPDAAAHNLALCRALYRSFDTATPDEIEEGVRREGDVIEELRPIYWLVRGDYASLGTADACAARLEAYDFVRAEAIRAKLGLRGSGPYLAVLKADETAAAVIDLGAAPIAETPDLVRYFKTSFSQEADVWSPARRQPEADRAALSGFLGRPAPERSLPQLILLSIGGAGCRLGDLFDLCGARREP